MAAREVEREFYVCDPERNKECGKGPGCVVNGGPCRYTKNPKYSKIGTLPFKSKVIIRD